MLRDFKSSINIAGAKITDRNIEINKAFSIDLDNVQEDYIEIPAYDIKPKEFSRAKIKRETKKMIEEELYGGR